MLRIILALLICVFVGAVSAGEFPLVENYAGRYDAFVDDALAFVEENPQSPFVPRLLADLYTLGLASGHMDLARHMRLRLLDDHPGSLHSHYMFNTIPDIESFKDFMFGAAGSAMKEGKALKPHSFRIAIREGHRRFGKALFEDKEIVYRMLIHAYAAQDAEIASMLHDRLELLAESNDHAKEVLSVYQEQVLGKMILKAHSIKGNEDVNYLKNVLLSWLPELGTDNHEVIYIAAATAIKRGEHDRAEMWINRLPEAWSRLPMIETWRARIAFLRNDNALAAEMLRRTARAHQYSGWLAFAEELAEVVEEYDDILYTVAEVILNVARAIAASKDFQMTVNIMKDDIDVLVFAALSTPAEYIEVHIHHKGELLAAYQQTAQDLKIAARQTPVYRFSNPGTAFAQQVGLEKMHYADFQFQLYSALARTFDDAVTQTMLASLQSPYTLTHDSIFELINYMSRKQNVLFSKPEVHDDGSLSLDLIITDIEKPRIDRMKLQLDAGGRRLTLKIPEAVEAEFVFGPAGEIKFTPPEWGDTEEVEREQFEPQMMLQIITALLDYAQEMGWNMGWTNR